MRAAIRCAEPHATSVHHLQIRHVSAIQPVITLYGRRGCHLCAEARKMLDRLAPRLGFTVEEIDIDTDAELLVRYDIIVPVVAYGKDELARAPIDHAALQRLVAAALGGR